MKIEQGEVQKQVHIATMEFRTHITLHHMMASAGAGAHCLGAHDNHGAQVQIAGLQVMMVSAGAVT